MRLALAALSIAAAAALASAAGAETWKLYGVPSETGLQWSYDTDYSYRDAASGKVVVLQAIGKNGANPRMGPSAPGAADGVGSVVALDCKGNTMITIGSYAPSKPLELSPKWRDATPKKISTPDYKALLTAACADADSLPSK